MFWFVNIAILLLGYAANKAIAGWLKARQKPALPGPFEQPTVSSGTGFTLTWGTNDVEAVCVSFVSAKLVEQNLASIDNVTKIGSRKTVAYMYKVTAQLVLCVGDVPEIRNMLFADKVALSDLPMTQTYDFGDGVIVPFATFGGIDNVFVHGATGPAGVGAWEDGDYNKGTLFVPNAFGGKGRGGGLTAVGGDRNNPFGGWIRFYRGRHASSPDAVLEESHGVGNVPAYGRLCHVVFDDVNVGESTTMPPIKWIFWREPGHIIPGGIGSLVVSERTIVGRGWNWFVQDTTGAVIAYDILVDNFVGLSQPPHMIYDAGLGDGWSNPTFEGAHRTLQSEGLGMSLKFVGTRENAEAALREIERTCDAFIDRDPLTFKWTFRLNRNEASTPEALAALVAFGKNELLECTLSKPDWPETFNEVTVEYRDADAFFKPRTVTLQNLANIAQTGSIRALPNVQYLGVTYRPTARKLCARDLRKVSIPLWKGKLKITRSAWRLVRGQCFRLTYDHKYPGVTDKVFRVVDLDFGEDTDEAIAANIIEDVFAYGDIQRPLYGPSDPRRLARIQAPVVVKTAGTVAGTVATAVVTLDDPERRVYEIAFRTQEGTAAPSAWTVVSSATPNASTPGFPFINPATDDDFNGDNAYNVNLVSTYASVVEYRIRYVGVATAADPYVSHGELTGFVSFDGLKPVTTATGLFNVGDKDNPTVIPTGDKCFFTIDFTGQLVAWKADVTPSATTTFDVWRKNGGTTLPTIADSLGLSFGTTAVEKASGTLTPINVAPGDTFVLDVLTNNNAKAMAVSLVFTKQLL